MARRRRPQPADFSAALVEGPWQHRFVSAGGLRFHVACTGPADGPPVVLLPGAPQDWWAMRRLLTRFGEAGCATYAMDLRGTGASDKPPEGYALPLLARDVAGVVAALGHGTALVLGCGFGGAVAWTMVSRAPEVLDGIVAVCSPHPGTLLPKRRLLVSPRALGQVLTLRSPVAARRLLTEEGFVGALLGSWVQDGLTMGADEVSHYAAALRIPSAADKTARMLRWASRPIVTAAHARFAASTRTPAAMPVLHVLTDSDPVVRWTACPVPHLGGPDYTFELLHRVGHLPAEEAPDQLSQLVLGWMAARVLRPA